MFEEKNTESIILKRMLDQVPSDLDKRESSIIYNTLAPAALELAMVYSDLDRFLEYAFVTEDTPEVYIEKRINEIGMKRKQSTKAIKKGVFYNNENKLMDIPLNSRFSIDKINYKAIDRIDIGTYKMECEENGDIGNSPTGNLVPIDYIDNLGKAELKEIIDDGKDIEGPKDLFLRFKEREQKPITSGNTNHYRQWALEVDGVGKCKVYPLWNGEGTVKIILLDNEKKTPSNELIDKVFKHIEEVRPIGPRLTIKGATNKKINISVKIKLVNGFNKNQIQQDFISLLDQYFKNIAFEVPYLSIAKIGNILLNTPGVLDYENLKINDSITNLVIQDEEIPIVDTITLEV